MRERRCVLMLRRMNLKSQAEKWKSLWQGEARPRHSQETEEFYKSYSNELKVLLGDTLPDSILEIGCGNGALYPYLGFDTVTNYRGVDVSESMIADFKKKFSDVDLVVQDGETFIEPEIYDFIFTNGVVQHFTKSMLAEHVKNSRKMLAQNGKLFMCMIPWTIARNAYCEGALVRAPSPGILRSIKVKLMQRKNGFMGRWIDHHELVRHAEDNGMSVKFHGSLHYPYRIHAVFAVN